MRHWRHLTLALGVLAGLMLGPFTTPANACYGEPCDAISYVCYTVEPALHKVKLDPTCQLG